MFGTKILEERKSRFNGDVKAVWSLGFGTYIQANGLTQSGGIVKSIWKSTLKKVKGKRLKVKNVLVLGLGGGTVVKIIRKYWPDAKITGVDIDPVMVELGQKYLDFNKKDIDVRVSDALDFLTHHSSLNSYDLIIVDLYNGDKFPKKFETKNYIHLIRTVLASGGIAVFNRLYYGDKMGIANEFGKKLKNTFTEVEIYRPQANIMFLAKS